MEHDKKAIGTRIKRERTVAGFKSQADFAAALGYSKDSRQTIWNWEKGERLPSLDDFEKMCEIFECELGYLLCEYDCKTREATNISVATGLSEKAVNKLIQINGSERSETMSTLGLMIEHESFFSLLSAIHIHFWNFKRDRLKIDAEDVARVADIMGCERHDVKHYMEASSKSLIELNFSRIVENLGGSLQKARQKNIFPNKEPDKDST